MDYRVGFGKSYDFFQKIEIVNVTFGTAVNSYYPDVFITFPTQSVMLLNEESSGVIEYSFNGLDVHGELDPTLPSRGLVFDNRVIGKIWFRVKSGSSGPITLRIDAWGTR